MEGHQLLNATFLDPYLNLCPDQAGIRNTISQVKVLRKGKIDVFISQSDVIYQQALMLNPNQLHCCHYCFHINLLAS